MCKTRGSQNSKTFICAKLNLVYVMSTDLYMNGQPNMNGLVGRGGRVGRAQVSKSRGPGFESPSTPFRILGKFVYPTLP